MTNWKRLPLIRHARYFYMKYRVIRWYDAWGQLGMHSGNIKHDYRVLDKIWKGEL